MTRKRCEAFDDEPASFLLEGSQEIGPVHDDYYRLKEVRHDCGGC